jgi:hypothetical protein
VFVLAFAAGAGLCVSLLRAAAGDELPEIRRVMLRPEQLPAELERVRRGVLRQLPQAEFDDLLTRATAADAGVHEPPRLIEARYRAILAGDALTGTATWELVHRGTSPGLLTVEPFNVALRKAVWDDGTPALIGDLGAHRPNVANETKCLVGRPGEQRLTLDWSARGVAEPAGLRFDLRLPASPVAVLDLNLPGDREPVVPLDVGLLTGPLPGAAADHRLWRIAFANASQIDLTIRPIDEGRSPLFLVRQRSRQDVMPGQTVCEFAFDLDAPHGGVRELTLECDAALKPTDVSARNLERWEVRPSATNKARQIVVRLREPLETGVLTLRAIGPAAPDGAWTSPSAAILGAVTRGEELSLRIHPDLRLAEWRSGNFRLSDSTIAADRWQVIALQSGMIRSGPSRPTARLQPAGVEYRVHERLWWSADAERMRLTAQLTFEVARGPVFQVPLRLPEGWDLERLDADPPDLLAAGYPLAGRPTAARPDLTVELQRPLTPGASATLTAHLSRRLPTTGAVPLPDVLPVAARGRDGTLAVRVGIGLQGSAVDAPPADVKAAADAAAPWGDAPADFVFPMRSAPVEGSLHLRPRLARYHSSAETSVTVVGREATSACRLRLTPAEGGADSVLVHVSGAYEPWDWQAVRGANRVRSVQRLAFPPPIVGAELAAGSPWTALTATTARSVDDGSCWRIALARPLTDPVELLARATATLPVNGQWNVPMVRSPAAEVEDGQVTIDLRSAVGWRVDSTGLTETLAADTPRQVRTFRYADADPALTLISDSGRDPVRIDRALLVTYAAEPGRLLHRLTFRVSDRGASTLPIDLPATADVRFVRINGATAHAAMAEFADRIRLEIPTAADGKTLEVEAVYATGRPPASFLADIQDDPPRWPNATVQLQRVWRLPDGLEPLQTQPWLRLPAGDLRSGGADLGDGNAWEPLEAGAGNSIRVVRTADANVVGIVAAVIGLALARAGRAWPVRWQWISLLVWLASTAVAAIWLPQPLAAADHWPLLAAVIVTAWKLLPAWPKAVSASVAPPQSSAARVVTAGLLFAVSAAVSVDGRDVQAAAPAATLVYIIPGPSDHPDQTTVLAPPDLLDRLRGLARRGLTGLDGAVWLDARYEGRVVAGVTRFSATLRLHSFADDPPSPTLPLTGVQLREARLDGSPAFLRTAGDRYLVPVHGRGPHTLELEFSVPVSSTGEDREVRFGIPELLISHLALTAPAPATRLQSLSWRGEQRVETDADQPRLEADLGRVGIVQVRWRLESATPKPATIHAQESYLWNMTESAARLFGSIRYTVGPGSATTLSATLPKELEVATVTARPVDPPVAGAITGWLRAWQVTPPPTANGRRSLVLEFAAPITGSWQVNFELAPREPFAPTFSLPFPAAVGTRSAPPSFAWRADGIELTDMPPDAASPLTPEAFLRDHWLPAKSEADPRPPTKAYQRTTLGPAPALRFRAATGGPEAATADIAWTIGPRRAEVEASAHVTVPGGVLSLVEWTVPVAVTIADVQGTDVYAWSRTNNRLQVWLNKPAAEATVRISGFVKRSAESDRFDVPPLRPRAALGGGVLRLTASEGVALTPVETTRLTESSVGRERSFAIEPGPLSAPPYKATIAVKSVAAPAKPPTVERKGESSVPPRPMMNSHPSALAVTNEPLDADVSVSPERLSFWQGRIVRTAVVLVVGLFVVLYGRRIPSTAWPEMMVLLGIAAFAAAGDVIWLLPAAIGLGARSKRIVESVIGPRRAVAGTQLVRE